jgi:hypothetical protein
MPFIPLDIVRLFDSDLYALSTGDEFKAALTLWGKSFLQVPAASLPSDDRILAHLSGAGSNWRKVKEMALRGWIKCDDDRLYHPVVAEKAREAWSARIAQRHRTEAARKAREEARQRQSQSLLQSLSQTKTDTVTTTVTDSVTASKGQGQGQGQVNLKASDADASGGKPPAMKPDEIIFGYGLPMLTNAGTAEKQARSFLGGLRKAHGDSALIDKLRECLKVKPLQPLEWLAAALPPAGSGPRKPAPENFNAINYGTGGRL